MVAKIVMLLVVKIVMLLFVIEMSVDTLVYASLLLTLCVCYLRHGHHDWEHPG
jgi:hypothetical protein